MQDIEINIFSKDFIFNKEREYFNDRLLSVSDNTNLENEFDEFDIYDNIRLNYIIRYFNSEDIGNKDLFLSDYGLINNKYNNIYIFRNITLDELKTKFKFIFKESNITEVLDYHKFKSIKIITIFNKFINDIKH